MQFISEPNEFVFKGTFTNGIAYAFTPNTRLKANFFSDYQPGTDYNKFGFFFQLITGVGLR